MPDDHRYQYHYDPQGGSPSRGNGDLASWVPILIFLFCFPPLGVILLALKLMGVTGKKRTYGSRHPYDIQRGAAQGNAQGGPQAAQERRYYRQAQAAPAGRKLSVTVDGVRLLDKVYFSVNRGDKIAFVGENELAQTALFKILMGELEPDEGSVKWGVSTIRSYLPKDNSPYFDGNQMELVDWLRQYSAKKDDVYLRGFLGRMLFSNEDVFKPVNVLSGGEKVRCMLSRMMLSGANVVLLDQPTNHLDMESIQAVNKGLEAFPGVVLLASHDHELLTSTCNRVIAFQPDGTIIDKYGTYDDYLAWMAERRQQG